MIAPLSARPIGTAQLPSDPTAARTEFGIQASAPLNRNDTAISGGLTKARFQPLCDTPLMMATPSMPETLGPISCTVLPDSAHVGDEGFVDVDDRHAESLLEHLDPFLLRPLGS